MNDSTKKLTQYLISSGYDQAVSTESLSLPSATEFANIITHLLRKIEPTFHNFGSEFEDEVAQMFRRIGYPSDVSKTALAAVGSSHTWPTLLPALTWLIDLLICNEANPKEEDWNNTQVQQQLDVKEIEQRRARTFFKSVSETYVAFLLGKNDKQAAYSYFANKFIECIERDKEIVAQKVEEITDLNAQLVASRDQSRMKVELAIHLEDIRNIIGCQVITVKDAERLQLGKINIEAAISKKASTKHECDKALGELKMELSRADEERKSLTFQCNEMIASKAASEPSLSFDGVIVSSEVPLHVDALRQSVMKQLSDKKQQLRCVHHQEQVLEASRTERKKKKGER